MTTIKKMMFTSVFTERVEGRGGPNESVWEGEPGVEREDREGSLWEKQRGERQRERGSEVGRDGYR